MNHLNELTMFEKDLLLLWFMHHMPMDQRHKMMLELPNIYWKLTGVKSELWTKTIIKKEHDHA